MGLTTVAVIGIGRIGRMHTENLVHSVPDAHVLGALAGRGFATRSPEELRRAVEELVRLTSQCRNTEERLAILEPYFAERLAEPSHTARAAH